MAMDPLHEIGWVESDSVQSKIDVYKCMLSSMDEVMELWMLR